MLKIYLGNMEKAIYHPPTYFDNQYEDEWITKELSIRMIKEVDKSDVINSSLIQSPVLGTISVKELSGSVKTLMLKDKDMRMAALSAGIGAIVSGVSEPALYGVNLRLRKPMIGLVLGGFIGGSVAGFMGAKAFSMGYSSILGVVIFEKTIAAIIAGVIVSFLVSFIVTFVLFNGKETK